MMNNDETWSDSCHDFEIFEQWMKEHYEQLCTEALIHSDKDSLEFLCKLDMYFASINFFNKNTKTTFLTAHESKMQRFIF